MHTTYHLSSTQEVNSDLIDSIKATFKSKPITIIAEEDNQNDYELSDEMKIVLDQRLMEDGKTYLSGEESIERLNKKYDL